MGYHSSFTEKINELPFFESLSFKIDDEEYLDQEISLNAELEISERDPLAILILVEQQENQKGWCCLINRLCGMG